MTTGEETSGRWPAVGPAEAPPLPWLEPSWDQGLRMPAHALLVVGAPGHGSLALQMALAQSWLCERPGPSGRACGVCESCHLVGIGSHPDLACVMPDALRLALGLGQAEAAQEGKRKPSRQIRIEQVRAATDWIVTTSSRGRAKVLLIHPAEAMNPVSANALLKTLEEPPQGTRLLLSCTDPAALLPTVRSRCQRLELAPATRAQAVAWLQGQGCSPDDAPVLLDAAGGRPLDAWALAQQGVTPQAWLALPQAVARGDATVFAGWSLAQVVDALGKLCHDLLRHRLGATPVFFPAAALSAGAGLEPLLLWSRELGDTAARRDHPLNEALQVESLVLRARHAVHATPAVARAPAATLRP